MTQRITPSTVPTAATSRRTLLFGAAGVILAARLVSACDDGTGDGAAPATARGAEPAAPTMPPTTRASSAPASPPSPTTAPEPAPSVTSATTAWEGADFTELDVFLERTNGEAFAIWEDGAMVHEWYRTDPGYTRDIASAQKSLLSLLIGRAIGDGLLTIDTVIDEVLGSTWTPHGKSTGITIEHLLTMTSGLDNSLSVISPPGASWLYSDAFSTLFDVLTTVTGRPLNDVAREWLFVPAGATSSVFYERPVGPYSPIGLRSTVPDLVKFGRLVLAGGPPGLTEDWLTDSFTASQPFNQSYGDLWWLVAGDTYMLPGPNPTPLPGPMVPTAPTDMVAALGKDDQKLYISAELDLVVARLGGSGSTKSALARSDYDIELWDRLTTLRG